MNTQLTQEEIDFIPKECRAVIALAEHFGCEDTQDAVFAAAFEWYYVPRAPDRIAYAKRVVDTALESIEGPNPAPYPDWFWRVYEVLISGQNTLGSILPPPDPK